MSELEFSPAVQDAITRIKYICAASNGRSQYYPYGGSGYKASVTQFFESSSEIASGAVQPGSEEDLAKIINVISDTQVPFAVKCGGHTSNPGFSSTKGIQIYLSRLNNIRVDVPRKLVHAGAGCLFGELYKELDRYELGIVGGSGVAGVGLSGWMLGGGYSCKTSQYGLGIDNLVSARVVLSNGTIKTASNRENPDLFFAIKGGVNNFGIVTEFTLKAHRQPKDTFYYHELMFDKPSVFPIVKRIINKIIASEHDNKLNLEVKFRHYGQSGKPEPKVMLTVDVAYDGSLPALSPFVSLLNLKESPDTAPLEHHETRSFLHADLHRSYMNGTCDLSSKSPVNLKSGSNIDLNKPTAMAGIGEFPRGRWGNVMVDQFTPGIFDEMQAQAGKAAKGMADHGGTRIIATMWPFTTAMFDKAKPSAWPHKKGEPNCPLMIFFTWEDEKNDDYWTDLLEKTLANLRKKVLEERPNSANLPRFINTSFAKTTKVEDLYRENLPHLEELRKKYDPHGLMDHTGGFRIRVDPGVDSDGWDD